MIICLACGNCTDIGTCEVCGMVLTVDDSHDKESDVPDLTFKSANDGTEDYSIETFY